MPRAVVLFSGGLDSTLAVRILQQQGLSIDALNIRTTFDCCRAPAAQTAAELGVRLTVLGVADDYVDLIRRPAFGYGKGLNPCVDCRIYMCRMAKRLMEDVGACLVATGEIVGQRPMSQKRRDLDVIAKHSGLEGRLLRPLSAKLLAPTIPEQEGIVDRESLYDFSGRARRPLIDLAGRLGIDKAPTPSTGCSLTEKSFAPRVRDLLQRDPQATRVDFELLNYGRHIPFDERTKVVVGRHAADNAALEAIYRQEAPSCWAFLHPEGFLGPDAVVVGQPSDPAIEFAAALVLRYAGVAEDQATRVSVTHAGITRPLHARPLEAALRVCPL